MKTNEQLRDYAEQALRLAQNDLTHDGVVTPRVWYEGDGGALKEFPLGPFADHLNDSAKKEFLFQVINNAAVRFGIEWFMFVCEAWMGESTAKALAMGEKEFLKRCSKTRSGFGDLIADGLITRSEVIMVSVHTRQQQAPLLLRQPFERDDTKRSVTFGEKVFVDPDVNVRTRLGFPADKTTQ